MSTLVIINVRKELDRLDAANKALLNTDGTLSDKNRAAFEANRNMFGFIAYAAWDDLRQYLHRSKARKGHWDMPAAVLDEPADAGATSEAGGVE